MAVVILLVKSKYCIVNSMYLQATPHAPTSRGDDSSNSC